MADGNLELARTDINIIRNRVGMPDVVVTSQSDSERHYVTNVLLNFVMKVFVGLISVVGVWLLQ